METGHQIYFNDAVHMLDLTPESIALVVTSPPYPMIEMWDQLFKQADPRIDKALSRKNGNLAFSLMHQALDKIWQNVYSALMPGGIACINIGDATRTINNEFQLFPNQARIIAAFTKMGCSLLPVILWRKPTNAPNKFMGSGMLPPNAYVTLEHEYVLIFRKKGKRASITEDEKELRYQSAYFWEERNQWFSDVWFDLLGSTQALDNDSLRSRSGAFPFELPHRLIHMFSIQGDIVLDPFLGTGTTMLAAMCAGRSSIGFEVDQAFKPLILKRIATVPALSRHTVAKRLYSHQNFIQTRLEAKKPPKHHNSIYDLPVITKQEAQLQLPVAKQVEYLAAERFKVNYQAGGKDDLPASAPLGEKQTLSADTTSKASKGDQLALF